MEIELKAKRVIEGVAIGDSRVVITPSISGLVHMSVRVDGLVLPDTQGEDSGGSEGRARKRYLWNFGQRASPDEAYL